ncbi:MAG: type II toxin-antitoxin system VapC family toxin [Bacillota bacterium]
MIVLFDTNILIDHLKGKTEATSVLQDCIHNQILLGCSVITIIELLSGMRPEENSKLELFLSGFDKIDVTNKIARSAGIYMHKYRKSYGINMADAIIAASAKHTDAKLYTLNTKHYPMSDIEVIKPY